MNSPSTLALYSMLILILNADVIHVVFISILSLSYLVLSDWLLLLYYLVALIRAFFISKFQTFPHSNF